MKKRNRQSFKNLICYAIILISSLLTLFPIIWTIITAIKPNIVAFKMPPVWNFKPTLESFKVLFSTKSSIGENFYLMIKNSIVTASIATAISTIIGLFAAYSLSRFRFKLKTHISTIILVTRMLPPIGTAIPLFLIYITVGLLDTILGLVLAYVTLTLPFTIWMLRSFIDEIPNEIEEAAMIDGCSRFSALTRVLVPTIAPGLASTAVYAFLLAWNDFSFALVLTNRNARTLPLISMMFMTEEGIMWGPMSAAIIIALTPPILFFTLVQKHITRGLTMGAVKG